MMHNNLFLNRLLIYTHEGAIAFDEKFHRGINIINGDNSSGKSTITQFIFYVLGGSFNDWVKEARLCSSVYAEVEMNGALLSLRRPISINPVTGKGNSSESIFIFWGSLAEGISSAESGWSRYGYNSSSEKKSFSNVFFENLGIPVVKEENNITFHQLLRLLYVDQESPTSSLFLYEQFDTTLTRETVAELLLGVYSEELYQAKHRKIEASRELDDIRKEIKVIKQFVTDDFYLIPIHVLQQIENKEKELSTIEEQILELRDESKIVRYSKNLTLDFQRFNESVIKQRRIVTDLESEIAAFRYEIQDTEFFLDALDNKQRALKNSISTREVLGDFPLDFCPECLQELRAKSDSTCKLCKEPTDFTFGVSQARKVEQEISFQIIESRGILAIHKRKLLELESSLESENVKMRHLQSQVNSALNDVRSIRDEKIDRLYVDKGFIESEIVQLRRLLVNAELYQKLTHSKEELDSELSTLNFKIDRLTNAQIKAKTDINSIIESKGLYLLNNDLKRQDEFVAANQFHIDYRNNIAFISDKSSRYSASSTLSQKLCK